MHNGMVIMKKSTLLNSAISTLVAQAGHLDEITICDAGLPIPATVDRIDMALVAGTPDLLSCIDALLSELQIEQVIMASELVQISPIMHQAIIDRIATESALTNKTIQIHYLSHDQFKQQTHQSKAIIRSGECTPFANVIFRCGVTF